ncbi:RNA dependent RNA polymerase-domain-containing protein [Aspergillus californicus]
MPIYKPGVVDPETPQKFKSGKEFIRIIDQLNEQYSLNIWNEHEFSPGHKPLDSPQWRVWHGLQRLYYSRSADVDFDAVLHNFEEWVYSRNAGDAVALWDGIRAAYGEDRRRAVTMQKEQGERMDYLARLVNDEIYILSKGSSIPRVRGRVGAGEEGQSFEERGPEEAAAVPILAARSMKRRLSTEDGEEEEFQTAPNSPEKGVDEMNDVDESGRATRGTEVQTTSAFMQRLTATFDTLPRYDAVTSEQNDPEFSFSTVVDTAPNLFTRNITSFTSIGTCTTEPLSTQPFTLDRVTDSGSTYDDSVVAQLLSEEAAFGESFTSNGGSFQEPRYSAEGEIVAGLLQHGPFAFEHSLSRSVPLLYRYELERIGRAWNVPLNRMLAGSSMSLKYDEFWKWIECHSQRDGKPVPERSSRKAWDAAGHGLFRTEKEKHPETVALTGEFEWCAKSEPGVLKLKLNPLKTDRPCRFHRRFGSDRFLSLTLPAPARPPGHLRLPEHPALLRESIALWLVQNSHKCFGRTWQPFFVEEVKQKRKIPAEPKFRIDFFAVDGIDFERYYRPSSLRRLSPRGEEFNKHTPMILESLLQWHLAIDKNSDQTNLKLFQRISLGLSKTFATIVLKPKQVLYLKDELGHRVMNDGCALMSRKLANMICDSLGIMGNTPSAFQGRIAGAKGLWMVDAYQSSIISDDDIWIQISDSQLKIGPHPQQWEDEVDDEQLTFEVVKWSKPLHSVDLNIQLLAILDHGGHVKEYIADLARLGIQAVTRDFEEVLKHNSPALCRSLAQKIRPTENTSAGFMFQSVRRLEQWTIDDVEAIIRFSEAGFAPQDFYHLRRRLGKCLRDSLDRCVEEMRIEVPLSTYAFCIADPYGVLKEDEVHFGFSNTWRDDHGNFEDNLLDGMDVLVGRLPAHLPSDIQRRRAVWKPELRHFKDVIVFPTTGHVPLADTLSGGDYDGDTPWICWDQNIVQNFDNTSPPTGTENYPPDYFGLTNHSVPMREIETIPEFLESSFAFNLTLSNLGRCTVEHEKLSYEDSLDCPKAKELSVLLSHLVDGRKAGVHLSEAAWKQYRKKISPRARELPAYKNPGRKPNRNNIIDHIRFVVSRVERYQVLMKLEKEHPEKKNDSKRDQDLVRPYDEARQKAELDRHEGGTTGLYVALKQTTKQLDELYHQWNRSFSGEESSFSPLALEAAYQARAIPPTASGNHPMMHVWRHSKIEWLELMASYLHKKHPQSNFVIHAFGEELCQIKSRSFSSRTVTNQILACYQVNKRVIARLKVQDGEEESGDGGDYEGHEAIEAMLYGTPTTGVGGYYDPDDHMSVE